MPVFLEEASALHAPRLVWERVEMDDFDGQLVRVAAVDSLFCRQMLAWQNTGEMKLRSRAATEIVSLCHRVSEATSCPMLFGPAERRWHYCQQRPVTLDALATVVAAARIRVKRQILPKERGGGQRNCAASHSQQRKSKSELTVGMKGMRPGSRPSYVPGDLSRVPSLLSWP